DGDCRARGRADHAWSADGAEPAGYLDQQRASGVRRARAGDVDRYHAAELASGNCRPGPAKAGSHERLQKRTWPASTGLQTAASAQSGITGMKEAQVEVVPAAPLDVARGKLTGVRQQSNLGDYIALTKPRLNFLVVVTSAAGYYLGSVASINLWDMAQAVVGTALVASGAAVLNQVYERDTDAMMRRTLARPLPDHRL